MPTYFGQQTQTATDAANSTGILYWTGVTFSCPGTGNQYIQELSVFCHLGSSTDGSLRVGVYSGTTLVAEGTSAVNIVGSTLDWQGHMNQASVKAAGGASPGVLVGGSDYTLAFAFLPANGNPTLGETSGGTSDNFHVQDYSAGMPTTLPTADGAAGYRSCVRCGVDPAPTTSLMPQIWM